MMQDNHGDAGAAGPGARPSDRAACGVSPVPASPPIADFARFLNLFDRLSKFEGEHVHLRGWGEFTSEERKQFPDPAVVRVIRWISTQQKDPQS